MLTWQCGISYKVYNKHLHIDNDFPNITMEFAEIKHAFELFFNQIQSAMQ